MIMTVSVSGGGEGTPSPTDRTDIPTRSPINVDPGPPTRSPIHVDPGPPQPTPPTKGTCVLAWRDTSFVRTLHSLTHSLFRNCAAQARAKGRTRM
jgi:hypothetical protein